MLAADVLGFVVTAAIILFVTSKLLGARVLTSAVVAIVASVGIYELFSGLLRVPLPMGIF
jgi:putative tricarboxylic transport membrane protein